MLILTRSVSQKIRIGDEISVTVFEVTGNQVRIGIDAPKHIAVHRSEIYDKINNADRRENAVGKSNLYDALVAKVNTNFGGMEKTRTAKATTITIKKRRQVAS